MDGMVRDFLTVPVSGIGVENLLVQPDPTLRAPNWVWGILYKSRSHCGKWNLVPIPDGIAGWE